MPVIDRPDYAGSSRYCPVKRGIRIVHDHDHTNSPAAEGFGTEVPMFRKQGSY